MPNLTEGELLEDIAAVQEDLDDSDDLPRFEQRVERLRRAALRPSPQQQSIRRTTARCVARFLRRGVQR
jgi:hypothetical protein